MKKLEIIIRPDKLEDIKETLNDLQIYGMTVTMATGCGQQRGIKKVYRGNEYRINLLPKIKVETVVKDAIVEKLVEAVTEKIRTGEVGDGKIFVYGVEQVYKIRTGESGEDAI